MKLLDTCPYGMDEQTHVANHTAFYPGSPTYPPMCDCPSPLPHEITAPGTEPSLTRMIDRAVFEFRTRQAEAAASDNPAVLAVASEMENIVLESGMSHSTS